MRSPFKKMLLVGLGMTIAGFVSCSIPLAFSSELKSNIFQWNDSTNHGWRFDFFDDFLDEYIDWDWGQSQDSCRVFDDYGKGKRIVSGLINRIQLDANGVNVEIVKGKRNQSRAELIMQGDLKPNHVKYNYDPEDREWEISINTGKNKKNAENYKVILTVPPYIDSFEINSQKSVVSVKDIKVKDLEIEDNMGNVSVENVQAFSSELTTKMGNIEGNMNLTGRNKIECNMGTVQLDVSAKGEYGYKIENKMGNVTIDKNVYSGFSNEVNINPKAPVFFDIECSMGNVTISL